ncbi:hypothetical protein [Burkholderia thailandensis]|uniref:hypothetical protein n=1 Tax=Burkholderia thailandensis TaxID=57975 RepID=UPI00107ED0E5|nr:hypothetical protein [Burkholderia thailandensis]TGB34374.1 hypothetical protein C6946_07020 [Burkholderia thailandensis]
MDTKITYAEKQLEAACDAVAEAIGSCAYDCMRVWEGWSVGTMGPDDFLPIADDADRVHEIAVASLDASGVADALMALELIAAEDDAARHNGKPLLTSGVRMALDAALIKAGRKAAPARNGD